MKKYFLVAWAFCFVMITAIGAVWSTPLNLGPTVNSASNDSHPTIASNGAFIIFESNRPGGQGWHDLWITDYDGSVYQMPTNMGTNVNTGAEDYAPYLGVGQTRLFWCSNVAAGGFGGYDVWYCPMSGGDPGIRVNIGAGINSVYNEVSPVVTNDGNTMYFATDRVGTTGGYDIYTSVQSGGSWQTPTSLGNIVNSPQNEEPVWISDDGNTLVFISNRPGGSYGGLDLWYTIKGGGGWGTPINLGSPINTANDERGATFRCNGGVIGGWMFLGSSRPGGNGGYDVWQAFESGYVKVQPQSLGIIRANFK